MGEAVPEYGYKITGPADGEQSLVYVIRVTIHPIIQQLPCRQYFMARAPIAANYSARPSVHPSAMAVQLQCATVRGSSSSTGLGRRRRRPARKHTPINVGGCRVFSKSFAVNQQTELDDDIVRMASDRRQRAGINRP